MRAGSLIDSDNTRVHRERRRPKRRHRNALVPVVVLAIVGAAVWFAVTQDPSAFKPVPDAVASDDAAYAPPIAGTVERVVDGDTVVIQVAGVSERVRLLNIDTPESVKPDSPVECLGPEASAFLTAYLPAGTPVTLEFDRDERDRYDRILAGVRTGDGVLVNAAIARAGFAELLEIGGNDRFTPDIEVAVEDARAAAVGLWAPGVCG